MTYAELQVTSNFSFLRGASHPEEMVEQAHALGLAAVAIVDRNSVAGVVRAHVAAKKVGARLVVGCRLDIITRDHLPDFSLLIYPTDRAAYGRLVRLLTLGKRRAPKGECYLFANDLGSDEFDAGGGQMAVLVPPDAPDDGFNAALSHLKLIFKKRLYLAVFYKYNGRDVAHLADLAARALAANVPLVATNDVHAHTSARRPLQDVLACIREHVTVATAGHLLHANAERHLKPAAEMARLFTDYPQAIANSLRIADACQFSLDELRYDYPVDAVPEGEDAQTTLARLSWEGTKERYPDGVPDGVIKQITYELTLIAQLGYAPYFLTVHDIVRFARSRGILCQGRGSAANSAVCYVLGITAVDPARIDVLFERFISAERDEPPDIDVDFEHERREEVIQYIYARYGRDRAALTAAVVSYKRRSALREVGKAMGLSADVTSALSGVSWGHAGVEDIEDKHLAEAGVAPDDPLIRRVLSLAAELFGFPRHLTQHSGGMVMTRGPLDEIVPIENAAMDDRTVIEWDKDDLDALGILKVDVLALGMLSCIRRAFGLISTHYDQNLTLATIPPRDAKTYEMLCRGDSLGVFQVESRAQMAMLPRLKPRKFYDLVIEVAIVRPGPIQGDMVHPYLNRRSGKEQVVYPSKELEAVLGKTLGVPLFQEQAMKIAIVAAGFTPTEADQLRRAMATFRKTGQIHGFRDKMINGMASRGYEVDFAERCFKQIEGFADYGFPESHAASFALLVYVSAWLKRHHPAAFACALLNSQPMGFYAPAQIVRDARDHGVKVLPVDVNHSDWDCTLETGRLRLGFRQIKGLRERDGLALVAGRTDIYVNLDQIQQRSGVSTAVLETLAKADAFGSITLERREAWWAAKGLNDNALPLFAHADKAQNTAPTPPAEPSVTLPAMSLGEAVAEDYQSLRLSLRAHPVGLLRRWLAEHPAHVGKTCIPCVQLDRIKNGRRVTLAGLVITRQRPGTAKGVIFITLEDESAIANLIVWPDVFESYRRVALQSRLLGITGRVQKEGRVIHVIVEHLVDLSGGLRHLVAEADQEPAPAKPPFPVKSRDFR